MSTYDETSSMVGSSSVSSEGGDVGRAHSQSSMVLPGWKVLVGDNCGNLDDEILGVAGYLSLEGEDMAARNLVRSNIQMVCGGFWPDAVVKKYGSAAYNTAVPSSDIDLVVEGCGPYFASQMYHFCMTLETMGYVRIGEASSPTEVYVKLADPTRSRLDINLTLTAGRSPARSVAVRMSKMLDAAPAITPVYKVLRTLLTQCKLKDATKGGVSSYTLLMMVFHVHAQMENEPTPAALLKRFLAYFGSEVAFGKSILTPHGEVLPRDVEDSEGPVFISDFSPEPVNVAGDASKIGQVKAMFKYCALAVEKWDGASPDYEGFPAILSTFITAE